MVLAWTLHHGNGTRSIIHYIIADTAHYCPEKKKKREKRTLEWNIQWNIIKKNATLNLRVVDLWYMLPNPDMKYVYFRRRKKLSFKYKSFFILLDTIINFQKIFSLFFLVVIGFEPRILHILCIVYTNWPKLMNTNIFFINNTNLSRKILF